MVSWGIDIPWALRGLPPWAWAWGPGNLNKTLQENEKSNDAIKNDVPICLVLG